MISRNEIQIKALPVEERGGILLQATNRRIARRRDAFVMNEPELAGALVTVINTLPEFPF